MTMARAKALAVNASTAASIAPSRKCACQSSGRRSVKVFSAKASAPREGRARGSFCLNEKHPISKAIRPGSWRLHDRLHRRLVPHEVRQARERGYRVPDRQGRDRGDPRRRTRARGDRRDLHRHHERWLRAPGIPVLASPSSGPVAPLQASDPGRERLRHGFGGVFGRIAQMYFQRYGDRSDALARIAAKNHKNGAANPLAQMQKDLGYDFCRTVSDKNPIVAGPLKRTDCSLVSDGAAAVVLADTAMALSMKKAVIFRAAEQVNDFLPMSRRDIVAFEGPALAWRRALAAARLSLADLDLVETHDCFTIAELIEYEAMGLTPPGDGARAVLEGWTEKDGKLPVNPSGGLKSKGHPIGATVVSMHVLAAMQVTGTAGGIQVPGASLAGVMNMGGAAVANFVSILEPLRA